MSAKNDKTTVETVVAKAAEEKLVTTVPAQADGEAKTTEETTESPELKVIEGGKKSVKERLADVTAKLKENKKALIAVGAAAGVAALAFAKYAKKKAVEALEEAANEETVTEDGKSETPDESAA